MENAVWTMRCTPSRIHGTDMLDFVLVCMSGHSAPTGLSGHKPLDVPRLLCCFPMWATPLSHVLWQETGYLVSPHTGPGRILPAITKRTIGHWDILAYRL